MSLWSNYYYLEHNNSINKISISIVQVTIQCPSVTYNVNVLDTHPNTYNNAAGAVIVVIVIKPKSHMCGSWGAETRVAGSYVRSGARGVGSDGSSEAREAVQGREGRRGGGGGRRRGSGEERGKEEVVR